jgi:hypothetical protein
MRLPCWLVGHTPLLTRRNGVIPGTQVIVWVCRHCLKHLGDSEIVGTVPAKKPPAPPEAPE